MIRLLDDASEVDECRAAASAAIGILRNASPPARRRLQTHLSAAEPFVVRYYSALALGLIRDHASTPVRRWRRRRAGRGPPGSLPALPARAHRNDHGTRIIRMPN